MASPHDEEGLLARYEVEDGEFVFETGRDLLGIDGDEIVFTVTDTKDGGEILGFEWESIAHPNTSEGSNDATVLTVKTGDGTFQQIGDWRSDGSFHVEDFDYEPPLQAVSNVVFCIDCAFWQIDLGGGDPPVYNTEDPGTAVSYHPPPLIAYATRGRWDGGCGSVDQGLSSDRNLVDLDDNNELFDVDLANGTASIGFTVPTDSDPLELHLGVWEMPGPFDLSEQAWGPRFDLVQDTFDPGIHYDISIDLPTV